MKDRIRIICNTENFVPIVVPGLSSSSSGSSSTFKDTFEIGESFFFINFIITASSSSSSPTVSDIQIREREDATNSDISPVPVSDSVDMDQGDLRKSKPTKTQNQTKRKPR